MGAVTSVVVGTRNPHKVREITRLLEPGGISVRPLPSDVTLPPEDGASFAENALPKARIAARQTAHPAIADDSGIEAEALGGAPGVRSARFAGVGASDQQNLAKLLSEAPAGSRLRYVCALAYVDPRTGEEHVFHGYCHGHLAAHPRGAGGFGYDPAFVPDRASDGRTMAELSDHDKDAISHRGEALRAFMRWLAEDETR
jgi:XTP/dITP diphosphohydrolase